jgi:hypothetical protein
MSNDEVIRVLKNRIPQKHADTTPNPAGEVELSEDDLDAVAGGSEATPTLDTCSAEVTICKGTCCVPFVGGCCDDTVLAT